MAGRQPLSTRVYAAALKLYSAPFRRRFAAGMIQAFEWRMAKARERGRLAVAALAVATAADTTRNAAGERLAHLRALRGFASDMRVSVRRMARQPGESLVAIATLAVGIGAVTAIFGIVHAVLLSPLPFPESGRVVAVLGSLSGRPAGVSLPNVRDLDRALGTFEALTPFSAQSVNLTGIAEPDRIRGGFVTSGFFDVVATPPALGRALGPEDDAPGAAPVAVLSHEAWQRRFGGAGDVLARRLTLNNAVYSVVGVMPRGFDFPIDEVEIWLPMRAFTGRVTRDAHNFFVVGRLRGGATLADAQAEASSAAGELARRYPGNEGMALAVRPLQDTLTTDSRAPLGLLFAMVTLMLLAACVNVAGLKAGATISRSREIATRAALGAGRLRLAAQMIGESVIAGCLGALAGVAVAAAALQVIVRTSALGVYGLERASVNLTVLLFAVGAGMLAGALAGLLPALHWSRLTAASPFRDGTRVTGAAGGLRSLLVVAQIALAVVTLTVAGLLMRSYARLASVDPGFNSERVLSLEYRLPRNKYADPAAQAAFHAQVLEKVRAVPGVVDAASVRALPFSGNGSTTDYRLGPADRESRRAGINTVSDRFFETLAIPIVRGRAIDARDRAGSPPAIVVSASFARRNWPGADPVGQAVHFDGAGIVATVVGVAGDVRHSALDDRSLDAMYVGNAQNPGIFMTLAVKTEGQPLAVADAVRAAVWSVDPDQPMWKIRSLASLVDASLGRERFLLRALAFFAVSATVLALLATYGSVVQSVTRRRREIGVRLALGARPASVLALVMRGALRLCGAGIVVGAAAALAVAPGLRAFLYGIGPADPATFAGACLLLFIASVVACWVPARRALAVDPVVALRES